MEDERPAKTRRIARACLQCRARKQRCMPLSDTESLRSPCRRCQQIDIPCSFTTEPVREPDLDTSATGFARAITELQRRLKSHGDRITKLEKQPNNDDLVDAISQPGSASNAIRENETRPDPAYTAAYPSPGFSFDQLDFGTPIATLRSLGAVSAGELTSQNGRRGLPPGSATVEGGHEFDPIAQGVLSISDAQRAVRIFFENCHPMAPLLDANIAHSIPRLQRSHPRLLLTICSIGTRFWPGQDSSLDLHPNYSDLVALLDIAVSRLLLRPNTTDANIESIQVLLLYAQWMPCDGRKPGSLSARRSYKSRYNDISAWAVLGLAARYARLLDVDRHVLNAFDDANHSFSGKDMARIRLLNNLLTCDYNLMLSSGLPASVDISTAASISDKIGRLKQAQLPEDLRIVALVQLVVVAYNAIKLSGDPSGRHLDASALRRANVDFDDWDRTWIERLRHTTSQHNQLPFTSARWYRLALNSACLGPLLSPASVSDNQNIQIWLLQSLEVSLTAASQILLSLSVRGQDHVWAITSQERTSFPKGPFVADKTSCRRLRYAVDSTWISHTFAIAFLALCYIRGAINDNLQISCISQYALDGEQAPSPPRPDSLLSQLLHLGNEIFDEVCQTSSSHCANDFREVIRDATSLVLSKHGPELLAEHELDFSTVQAFSDLMNEFDTDWPGNLFDLGQ